MKPRSWVTAGVLALMVAGAAIGLGTYVLAQESGSGLDTATVDRLVNPENPFPDVAATVNGQPISGVALARKVEVLKINYESAAGGVPNDAQLATEALDSLISAELLAQAANERGLWPTQQEVVAQAQKLKEAVLQFPEGSPEREAAEMLWEGQGVNIDEIDSNPTVLENLASALATGRVTSDVGRPPPGYPIDIDARTAAISDFVDSLRSDAEIEIYVSTTAQ